MTGGLGIKVALREERALVLVTDSTSALIHKDHGQIVKGDMAREVEMAAQSSGHHTYRLLHVAGQNFDPHSAGVSQVSGRTILSARLT